MEENNLKLTARSIEIFTELVDAYIETGEAVGSRLLSKRSQYSLSSATIRNIMSDLEDLELLYAPHTSSGRVPTQLGLRYFINGLLECKDFEKGFNEKENKQVLELLNNNKETNIQTLLEQATSLISGLSKCVGIVMTPKTDPLIRKIEFVLLNQEQLLVIMIGENGTIENRIIKVLPNINESDLQQSSNYLSAKLRGKTLSQGLKSLWKELEDEKNCFDSLTTQIVSQGIEIFRTGDSEASLILRGQANLLENIDELDELKNIKTLFDAIDTKSTMVKLLDSVTKADGIKVFIGSESEYFNITGCSLVVSPYKSSDNRIIGAIGVIGHANMQYRRIIPLVNYTSKIIGKLLKN